MPSAATPTVPQADVFSVTPAASLPVTIHYWLTIPKTTPGAAAPIVIAQHGLTSWRGDVFTLGEDFAKNGGAATIAFDLDFHGARTRCSSDDQCLGGAGSCDTTTGACQGGFKPQPTADNPFSCVLAAFSGDNAADCKPAASGNGVLDPSNLFGGRIGGYQYVVDAAQLERVLAATGGNSLQQQLATAAVTPALDPTHVRFIGQSLGGIDGTVFLATDPGPGDGNVLSVAGGHLFELLADGAFKDVIDQFLMAQNIMRGTPAYAQLVATARWVLDPVDPWSVARMINRAPSFSYVTGTPNAPKLTIVQEAGMDTVIPPQYEAAVSSQLWWPMGVDAAGHAQGKRADGTFVSTYFPDATHGTLLSAMPSAAMRTQAVTYVLSAGAALPAPTP
jgi:pimeloyl-ACP methyl ester carboxylesterase